MYYVICPQAFSQSQSAKKPLKQTNNVQETTVPSKIIEELPKRRSHRIKDKNIYTVHQPDTTIGGNQHNSRYIHVPLLHL